MGAPAAPVVTAACDRVAFVLERDDACDIAVVALDGSSWPRRVSHADYAWDPAWSPDGSTLAWHEWDLPDMPWDGSRIALADGEGKVRVVAGGDGIAVGQPRFAPGGRALAYVSDASGWMNVWVAAPDGTDPRPLLAEPFEQAEPSWGPGQRSFAWAPDDSAIALSRNEQGFGRLVVVSATDGEARDISRGWHRGLDWAADGIACVRSGGRTAPQVTVIDPATGSRRPQARGAVAELDAAPLPEPEPVTWTGDDGVPIHGLLWRPPATDDATTDHATTDRAAPQGPPLLVDVHGGPTDQSQVDWVPRIRYFVSRGWAVLSPNYRGSTGYGRPYERALEHAWGVLDVADTVAGIRAGAAEGWADGSRVAVMGGSAGGFTALLVAAQAPPVVRAAVSLYGVTDLFGLAETTHRFESRYLDRLVGVLPDDAARYRDRSPVANAGRSRSPCSCSKAPTTRWYRRRRPRQWSTRCGRPARPSTTTCTKAKGTVGGARTRSSTRFSASTRSSLVGC